jgi:rod shape-determining protein MreC
MYKKKKTGIIGIIITAVILVIIVIISNSNVEDFSHIGGVLGNLVMPVQNGLAYLKNKVTGNSTFFSDISTLKEENSQLQQKNDELEQQLRELEIIKAENETLKEYVNLKDKYTEYKTVPGYVINRDTSNYSNIIIINVGEKDGIEVNMPVIANQGLVGHVISTTSTTAKVQTLLDTSSAVSSVVGTQRDSIVVKGNLENTSMLKASYIQTTASILEGDKVETSGLGGIYPKGITIGTVKQVVNTKNLSNRYALIEPAVDFDKIETVLVITE